MSQKFKGTAAIFLATFTYGLYNVYFKLVAGYPVFFQNYLRNLLIVIFISIYFIFKRKGLRKIDKKDFMLFIVWSFSGSFTMVMLFIALKSLPIGTVNYLCYAMMLISGYLFGSLLYKEKLNIEKTIAIIVCLGGLLLIYSLDLKKITIVYLFPVISGSLIGLWNTMSKKLSQKYVNTQMLLFDSLFTVVTNFALSLIIKENFTNMKFTLNALFIPIHAITQIVTLCLVVYGFKHLEAQKATLIMPVQILFATLFGYIFFHEVLSLTTLIGGVIIFIAAIVPNINHQGTS